MNRTNGSPTSSARDRRCALTASSVIAGGYLLLLMVCGPAMAQGKAMTMLAALPVVELSEQTSDNDDESTGVKQADNEQTEDNESGEAVDGGETDDLESGGKGWKVYLAIGLIVVTGVLVIFALGTTAVRASGDTSGRVDLEDEQISLGERMKAELSVLHRKIIEGDYRDLHEKANKWCKSLLAGLAGDQELRQASLPELKKKFEQDGQLEEDLFKRIFSILDRCDQVKFTDEPPSREAQEQLYHDCQLALDKALFKLAARPRENEKTQR